MDIEAGTNGALVKKVKFANKVPALDLLARHLQMIRPPTLLAAAMGFEIHLHLGDDDGYEPRDQASKP